MDNTIPKVDLNFRHYIGDRSDVIKEVLNNLKNYLRNPNIDRSTRVIYSAIYNALLYYQAISDLSISGETAEKTYLENTIEKLNEDYKYLAEKYNKNGLEVIKVKCRVKSPVSAMDKILAKVKEYVKTGRDLSRLNESLRDFIGIKFIITAPPEIKAQGKKAESDFCYQVIYDLLVHQGILRQVNNEETQEKDFDFIPVDTDHDPYKLQKIKNRAIRKEFLYDPEKENVYIPENRPEYIEPLDRFFKDYRSFPKPNLYQRVHICAHPYYSKSVADLKVPSYIIPSKSKKYALEYQFCTDYEEWWAEFGKSAHSLYKKRIYHRLAIPLQITLDKIKNKIRLNRLDECLKNFFGYSFEDRFGIDYQEFLQTFNTEERDDVLGELKKIVYDEKHHEYTLQDTEKSVILDNEKDIDFVKDLLDSCSNDELRDFYVINNIADNTIRNTKRLSPKIKLYKITRPAKDRSNYLLKTFKDRLIFEDGPEQ